MSTIKLRKIGGSVTAAITPHVLEALALKAGSELGVSVDRGRVVMVPVKATGRIGIAARLAMCDLTVDNTPEEQAEIDLWQNLKSVGREIIE